ncbi:MAG: M28 family peptidase [Cyclobacteriaceae bacterium]|nr:M28 family peptidase [Cyclobacteriaceae bacterium]
MKQYLILLFFPFILEVSAQGEIGKVNQTLNKEKIKSHIAFIASDEMRGRDTGSPELDKAADYIVESFKNYGIQPVPGATRGYYQEVPMRKIAPPVTANLILGESNLNYKKDLFFIRSHNLNNKFKFIYLNYGNEEDYKENVKGKIILCKTGNGKADRSQSIEEISSLKRKIALQKGAAGIIEIFDDSDISWNQYKNYFNRKQILFDNDRGSEPIIHAWVKMKKSEIELYEQKKYKNIISISIQGALDKPFITYNVVGMQEGSDPELKDEFIIYSAHYDHIGVGRPDAKNDSIYNGARDNAVGTVTVLAAAENLAKYPTKRSALFILFTGEEKGLMGSRYYTNNPLLPLNKMVYCFNSDNGGYNNTSLATIIGLNRTTAGSMIIEACNAFGLDAIDDPAAEQGLFDRSDNVNFARKGIPAPTFSLGFTAFDEEIMKYYHQPGDSPESLDYVYLEKFFKAYVLSARLIGNSLTTPKWVEGDKYFPASEVLYHKEE